MNEAYLWAESATAANTIAAWLIHMSQAFGLEPWPCDYWRFALKPDMYERVLLQFSDLVSKNPPASEPDESEFEFEDEDDEDDWDK